MIATSCFISLSRNNVIVGTLQDEEVSSVDKTACKNNEQCNYLEHKMRLQIMENGHNRINSVLPLLQIRDLAHYLRPHLIYFQKKHQQWRTSTQIELRAS